MDWSKWRGAGAWGSICTQFTVSQEWQYLGRCTQVLRGRKVKCLLLDDILSSLLLLLLTSTRWFLVKLRKRLWKVSPLCCWVDKGHCGCTMWRMKPNMSSSKCGTWYTAVAQGISTEVSVGDNCFEPAWPHSNQNFIFCLIVLAWASPMFPSFLTQFCFVPPGQDLLYASVFLMCLWEFQNHFRDGGE